jgi:hypothetical protein
MKKLYYFPILILIASVFVISCSKETSPLGANLIPAPFEQLPVAYEIGSIVDLGLINPDTRVMQTTLNAQNFVLNGPDNSEISGASALITLSYYVNTDAQIPPGEYAFSNSDSKSPFTFDSAFFARAVDINGNSVPSEKITDGTITVIQDGDNYEFQFHGQLESGATFSGTSKGVVTYLDNNIY